MEDEKSSRTISYIITIVDIVSSGKISAPITESGRTCIQLPLGRIKIRSGDDYITGSFSSTKREFTDAHGRFRVWRECHFGEITPPETGEQSHIGIEGVQYEIFITSNERNENFDPAEKMDMSRGTMFFRAPHKDVIEKFMPHMCTADCMRGCPGGVWVRD